MPLCSVVFARAVLNGAQVSVEELYLHWVIVFALSLTHTALSPLVDWNSRLARSQMFWLFSLITFPCNGLQEVLSWVGRVVMGGGQTTNVLDVEAPWSYAMEMVRAGTCDWRNAGRALVDTNCNLPPGYLGYPGSFQVCWRLCCSVLESCVWGNVTLCFQPLRQSCAVYIICIVVPVEF